jgi:hypothetical protein
MAEQPFQFVMPAAQLHPYLKKAVQDLDRHGFCILDAEFVETRGVISAAQREMFREACRRVSIEKDRNLVMGEISNLSEGALSYLADRTQVPYADEDLAVLLDRANAPGTVNEDEYTEDADGHGVLEETGQEIPVKPE